MPSFGESCVVYGCPILTPLFSHMTSQASLGSDISTSVSDTTTTTTGVATPVVDGASR